MYYGNRSRDGLGQFYSAMQFRQQEQKRKEAEEELRRQQEKQRQQQAAANKHSAFGDTLKLAGTVGGAVVGGMYGDFSGTSMAAGAAIGSAASDLTMGFTPNVGGTQPGADNPYYTPTSDTQKALLAVNAGVQFYSAYEADKIAKERALAAADAKARSAEKLRTTDFQTAQSYVTSGFDAQQGFEGLQGTEYTAMPSLARDLKDSGKYSFLKDEDFLMIAAGESDKFDKFGPTLQTFTLQASNLLLQELRKEGASTESVLAELDEGTAPWARQFKKAPRAAQVAAKSDFMKESRATLAAANAALQEKAESLAEFHQGLADTGNSEAIKSRNALMSLITSQDYRGEGSLPMGFTEEQISSGQIMSDPVLYRKLLSYSGTTNADIQFKAMQGTFGAISTFQDAFSKSELNRIAPSYEYVGGEGGEGAATAEDAANRGSAPMQSPSVDAQNVTQEVSENNQTVVEPVDRKNLVSMDVGESTKDAPKTREEIEAEAEEISAKQIFGVGSRAISTGQSTADTEPAPTESEQFLKNLYLGRDPQTGEMSQVLALKRDPRPETKMGLRQRYEAEPEVETPSEPERQVDPEQIDLEKQSLVGTGPQGDRTALLQSYGLPAEQLTGAAADPAVAPIQTSDMSDLQSLNALKDQVKAAPETRAAVPKEQAPTVSPLEQVLDLREAVDDKFQEINNKLDQAKAKVRQRGVRGETEMDSSLSERQAIYQTEAELSRIMTKFNSIEQQVMGQDSPSTRSPNVDQAYQDARDQYAELDQELAVLNTRLDKVLGGEQTSGRMMPRRGENAAPDTAAPAELSPAEVEPSAFETETLQNQINEAIRSYGKLSRGRGGISGVNTVKDNTSKAQASSLTPDALARAASWFDQQNFISAENPADNVSSLEFLLQQEINDLVLKAQYNDIPLEGSDDDLGLNDHAARARFLLRQIEQIQGVN